MKKNLLLQKVLLIACAVIFTLHVQAQNKIRMTDDQRKMSQLKQYVESHPVAKGQTNWAVETLKKYEARYVNPISIIQGNPVKGTSSNRVAGGSPSNDDCANAITLTEQTSCTSTTGDVGGSTQSMPADSCNNFISDSTFDVWYKFVAVTSNPYITVTGSASFDAVVFLFDACGGSILGCSDATINGQSETITSSGLTPGNTYYIRVYDYGDAIPATTAFDICVFNAPPPPPNDDCANAIALTEGVACVSTSGDVAWGSESIPPEECNTFTSVAGFDVWYTFNAVSTNPVIDVTGSINFDAVVFLMDGCNGSILGCSDSSVSGETESIAASGLTIGTTYYIRVYGYGGSLPVTTTFDICVYTAAVGIADIANTFQPVLFPNPTAGKFSLQFGFASKKTTIKLYDVLGNLVQERVVLNSKEANLDASALADGIYSVQVQNERGMFTQKVTLNR